MDRKQNIKGFCITLVVLLISSLSLAQDRDTLKTKVIKIEEELTTLVHIRNLHFESKNIAIAKEDLNNLKLIVNYFNEHPNYNLTLYSHTDQNGDEKENYILSRKRGDYVRQKLIHLGLSEERISVKAFGESQIFVPGTNDREQYLNRRIEFVITKSD